MCLISFSSFSQSENDVPLLGLPGDDLDLYAVLNLFQESKTIEDFEKSLNSEKRGIVNLDLNNDGKVDFIKVKTEKDGDDFLFILQDPISEKETQDVAVISVSKDAAGKFSMQIIGDEDIYGKDYVVEPRTKPTKSVTSNPAYTGSDPVTVNVQATTEVVVVAATPIVQYVYSPMYVPYYPPYYYGSPYPPYFRAAVVVGIGIYRHNNYHYHNNYHGGHGNTTVNIHNHNSYNNYNNNNRNSSRTVNNNVKNGNFKTSGQGGSRPSNRASTGNNRASTGNNRASTGNNRASTGNNRASTSNRSSSPKSYNRSSASRSMGSSRSSSAGRSYSGGASRGGASRGGGRRRN